MPVRRCVEVDLGSVEWTEHPPILDRITNHGEGGLGWGRGGALGKDRYLVYRDVGSAEDFDARLRALRELVGDEHADEVACPESTAAAAL
jgi:hypothetical protein